VPEFESSAPIREGREGLPSSYRMRAEAHYVDLLTARANGPRERTLSIQSIDAPVFVDQPAIAALVESIRRYGVLQPLLVQERDGAYRLIAGHKRLAAAVSAGLREVPCLVYEINDEKADALARAAAITGAHDTPAPATTLPPAAATAPADATLHAGQDLARALTSLTACADMLTAATSDMSRAVVANLVRAEAWRASTLLLATRVLRQELRVTRSTIPVMTILDRLTDALAAERRVRALTIDVHSELGRGVCIATDESLLTGALGGGVLATLALIDGTADARLSLRATSESSKRITFAVVQPAVAAPAQWLARAFDGQWTDRPGGIPALVSMLALQQIATLLGGEAAVESSGTGTRVSITLPAVDARSTWAPPVPEAVTNAW
jgi:hypothetical protein